MPHNRHVSLDVACRNLLLDTMRPGLKAAIRQAVSRGVRREAILAFVRAKVRAAGGNDHGLTVLAVEYFLDELRVEGN